MDPSAINAPGRWCISIMNLNLILGKRILARNAAFTAACLATVFIETKQRSARDKQTGVLCTCKSLVGIGSRMPESTAEAVLFVAELGSRFFSAANNVAVQLALGRRSRRHQEDLILLSGRRR